jgi:CheY-like chemotaxis protein
VVALAPNQSPYRILIVEDQFENWLLLKRILESVRFEVQIAVDGITAIQRYIAWRPHFIWMDWRLPGMDGLEAARRIRGSHGGDGVKIVMLSAFAFTKYRQEAIAAGIDDFMSKPFQSGQIFDCLARHLGVQYIFEQAAVGNPSTPLSEELASLPATLRTDLHEALVSLDPSRISAVIARVAAEKPGTGNMLSRYTQRTAYSPILNALRMSDSRRR